MFFCLKKVKRACTTIRALRVRKYMHKAVVRTVTYVRQWCAGVFLATITLDCFSHRKLRTLEFLSRIDHARVEIPADEAGAFCAVLKGNI